MWVSGCGGDGLKVGLDDLTGLFQPSPFYDSVKLLHLGTAATLGTGDLNTWRHKIFKIRKVVEQVSLITCNTSCHDDTYHLFFSKIKSNLFSLNCE